jgi:hypothetical protein
LNGRASGITTTVRSSLAIGKQGDALELARTLPWWHFMNCRKEGLLLSPSWVHLVLRAKGKDLAMNSLNLKCQKACRVCCFSSGAKGAITKSFVIPQTTPRDAGKSKNPSEKLVRPVMNLATLRINQVEN